jgi:hypothetical protein
VTPLISLQLIDPPGSYQPGDCLRCQYQVDAVEPVDVQAVEASVMWRTEGKGEEDIGVHFFQRTVPGEVPGADLRQMFPLETTLPKSPLSYEGTLVKIRWFVRVRLFLRRGKELLFDREFRLGPFDL